MRISDQMSRLCQINMKVSIYFWRHYSFRLLWEIVANLDAIKWKEK